MPFEDGKFLHKRQRCSLEGGGLERRSGAYPNANTCQKDPAAEARGQ